MMNSSNLLICSLLLRDNMVPESKRQQSNKAIRSIS